MNIKELEAKISVKVQEVQDLVTKDDIEGATKAKNELKDLQAKYDLIKDIQSDDVNDAKDGKKELAKDQQVDSVKAFADAARRGFPKNAVTPNTEGTNADGGYTVPADIQTRINQYRDAQFSLLDLIDVESVTTNKGSRTYQKKSQQTGFAKVGEKGKIAGKQGPQFERLDFEIDKYAGYFPVTNELLEDSDANITETLINWIGGESRATSNTQILAVIKAKTETDLANLDGIQKAIIVTLGAAYAGTSSIVTNDDGLLYLSTLKDTTGKYLLQPAPNEPMKKVLAIGGMSVPVKVIGNAVLASNTATAKKRKIPFIIGDLKEGIKKFDRKQTSIMASDSSSYRL